MAKRPADICLIVEGAYPFVAGGVSAWAHGLIEAQKHLRFALVAITADQTPRKYAYALPANVVSFQTLALHQSLPDRDPLRIANAKDIVRAALAFQRDGSLAALDEVLTRLRPYLGQAVASDILDGEDAWAALEAVAREEMPDTSFLHFFWSLRSLLVAFFSVLLAPLPQAGVYHAVSTGYAGLMAARARMERRTPVLLTEHGIYTNERRIEIASADWLYDRATGGLSLDAKHRTLKDVWTDCFSAYARAVYGASDKIVTLFRGNQEMQIRDGAPPEKCMVVPNGIDVSKYGRLTRAPADWPPTIALIGRVVPIKDVKTFLRATAILKKSFSRLQAFVLGPTDEDADYYAQCVKLARELSLEQTVRFAGRVSPVDYLPRIHVNVLTSLSEAQPLVLLEAGAAGVPTVATDVGACREMIFGPGDERPALGAGGAVVAIGDPGATADAIAEILEDRGLLDARAAAMKMRVHRYYSQQLMDSAYRHLYGVLLKQPGAKARIPSSPIQPPAFSAPLAPPRPAPTKQPMPKSGAQKWRA
jgi:glycosyltransferase involved in cell wall biosynthesis